jgi:hypothetical protein
VFRTTASSIAMSSADHTEPLGLCGELMMIMRVRGVIRARTSSQSGLNPGKRRCANTARPPFSSMPGT